jgi:hypothetical protein
MALSDARSGRHPFRRRLGPRPPTTPEPPPITQVTFLACRAHYPGGPGRVLVGFFPACAAFPQSQRGRRPHLHFRGLLKLHSRYGLPGRSPAISRLCHKAPVQPVSQPHRLSATMSYRQLHEWDLPPPVICALGAHVESRTGAVRDLLAVARFPFPLIKPDVRISRIRLSDWLHRKAHGRGPRWTRRKRSTPISPKTTASEKRRVPRECTLWRLHRKSLTP